MLLKSSLLLSLVSVFFVISPNAFASPDRIGNGGGVWSCEDVNHTVYDIMFMDVFEARREYQLTVPELTQPPLDIVKAQKDWIEKFLTDPRNITKHIEYVEKNITWIDDIINLIPDAASKISPHPSTCKQGEWKAVQLVNFTDDFRILVRREIFDSPYMSNLEKAAVYLHEGLYSYLRTDFGDNNSVRARAIVGYLLSDLADAEKVLRIQKVLKQVIPNPDPLPAGSWMCGIKPDSYSALYIFEAGTPELAKAGVLKACVAGETPSIPGMPGGGFPEIFPGGFPGGDFGPQRNCKEDKIFCEAITSSKKDKTCTIEEQFRGKKYTGLGRTQLEAQKEAMRLCMANESVEFKCYDSSNMTCN